MGDYSYGSVSTATSLSSVGHDSFSQSSQPSIDRQLDTSSQIFYCNSQTSQSQSVSGGQVLSESSADGLSHHNCSAVQIQNEDNSDINSKGSTKSSQSSLQSSQSSQQNSINTNSNSIETSSSANMQNLDEFTRRLSKSSNSKSDSESNDKQIDGQIKASVNGNSGNNSGNSGGNGMSGGSDGSQSAQSLPTHLNADSSSAVISSANEQQFWSTNCVTDNDVSQQGFIGSANSGLNGALQYTNYNNNMSATFANAGSIGPQQQLSNLPQSQHNTTASAQRRAITGAHNFPQTPANRQQPQSQSSSLFKTYTSAANWTGGPPQQPSATSWSTAASQAPNAVNPWGSMNMSNQKRAVAGVPNISPISPMKKSPPAMGQTPSMMISPSKFRRSTSMPMGKPFPNNIASGSTPFDLVSTGSDTTSSSSDSANVRDTNIMLPFQVLIILK